MPEFIPRPQLPTGLAQELIRMMQNRPPSPLTQIFKAFPDTASLLGQVASMPGQLSLEATKRKEEREQKKELANYEAEIAAKGRKVPVDDIFRKAAQNLGFSPAADTTEVDRDIYQTIIKSAAELGKEKVRQEGATKNKEVAAGAAGVSKLQAELARIEDDADKHGHRAVQAQGRFPKPGTAGPAYKQAFEETFRKLVATRFQGLTEQQRGEIITNRFKQPLPWAPEQQAAAAVPGLETARSLQFTTAVGKQLAAGKTPEEIRVFLSDPRIGLSPEQIDALLKTAPGTP